MELNTSKTYWVLQITGWATYTLINIVFASFNYGLNLSIGLFYALMSLVGLVVTHIYRYFILRNKWLELSIPKLSLLVLPMSILLAVVWFLASQILGSILFRILAPPNDFRLNWQIIIIIFFNLSVVVFVWSLLYFGLQVLRNYKQSEINRWKLEATLKESQLSLLKSQINPHFMFNSLNNIRALILEDPQKARDMLVNLSDLLRYALNYNQTEKVKVSQEIEMIESYLYLESIQLEDRLRYSIQCDEMFYNFLIPPMVIQILVENSIKHGITPLLSGGEISVSLIKEKEYIFVRVINTGSLKKNTGSQQLSTSIGLHNVTERLNLVYGKEASLLLYESGNQVFAELKIPYYD